MRDEGRTGTLLPAKQMRELLNDRSSLLRPRAPPRAEPPAPKGLLVALECDLPPGVAAPLRLLRLAALGRAEAGQALGEAATGAWTAEPTPARRPAVQQQQQQGRHQSPFEAAGQLEDDEMEGAGAPDEGPFDAAPGVTPGVSPCPLLLLPGGSSGASTPAPGTAAAAGIIAAGINGGRGSQRSAAAIASGSIFSAGMGDEDMLLDGEPWGADRENQVGDHGGGREGVRVGGEKAL